jgi:hypothetical protein
MSLSGRNFQLVFWVALIPGILAVALLAGFIQEPKTESEQTQKNLLRWDTLNSLGKEYWILVAVALLFNLGNSSDAFLLLQAQQGRDISRVRASNNSCNEYYLFPECISSRITI